jgi:hypothetical protein
LGQALLLGEFGVFGIVAADVLIQPDLGEKAQAESDLGALGRAFGGERSECLHDFRML